MAVFDAACVAMCCASWFLAGWPVVAGAAAAAGASDRPAGIGIERAPPAVAATTTVAPATGDAAAPGGLAGTADQIIVAVRDMPETLPSVGGTPHAYGVGAGYAGSVRAAAEAEAVASDHGLQLIAAWTIDPLHLRCMRYRIAPGLDRRTVLAALARDDRVQLAQPLNDFETLSEPPAPPYNDPYLPLQHGYADVGAAAAQHASLGAGVRVALIDTGVDAHHPDLDGRIATERDFVPPAHAPQPGGERHGTEMAGVIAAVANNKIGIVGIAPSAQLLVFRACWPEPVDVGRSHCDSYTLAQALGAAIAAGADVINLSLGGPDDPLLQRLVGYAIGHGAIIVGALPPGGRLEGFPAGVSGVLAVGASEDGPTAPAITGALRAPGRDILTLLPGGHYDYATGSSLAAAHVTGAVALLRSLQPSLRAEQALLWLADSSTAGAVQTTAGARAGTGIDACMALRHVHPRLACGPDTVAVVPSPH